jgi:RNA polymerase sigma-70 factor, ECF subfamily
MSADPPKLHEGHIWHPSGQLDGRIAGQVCSRRPRDRQTSDIGILLEPHLSRLHRYARALTHDDSRAEDLVQSCVVRALANQRLFRRGSDLGAWLRTILHNLFVSDIRHRLREQRLLQTAHIRPAMMPRSDPELSCQVSEVQDALGRLPVWQKQIVLQVGLERATYEDTASMLGIPDGTVRSRLGRARASLRMMTGYQPPARQAKRRGAADHSPGVVPDPDRENLPL